jgi:hypothetical protein
LASIYLDSDDLRIIGHSINWELNVPFEKTVAPHLSEKDTETLNSLMDELCELNRQWCLPQGKAAQVEIGEEHQIGPGQIALPASCLRLVSQAVASFRDELSSSPTEVEIVTGLPMSSTQELLDRLRNTELLAASCAEARA